MGARSMRYLLILTGLMGPATPAVAHIGHLGEVAGHGHWVAGAALGAAAAIALWKAAKGLKGSDAEADAADEATEEAEPNAEPQEV